MGLFDLPAQKNLAEDFPPGASFYMEDATYEGIKETSFGMQHQASILVQALDDDEQFTYRVWGVLAERIRDMENGDLPAVVCVQKEDRKNTWKLMGNAKTDITAPPTV